RHVAVGRRRAAHAGALLIGGARGVGAGAELRDVARAGRGPALGGRRLEGVRRAGSARARAELGLIAGACRGPALRAGGLERVGRAIVGDAVAALGDVAGAGGGAAGAGALRIRRTEAARAGAELCEVTRPDGGAALEGRRLQHVGRAGRARAAAELGDVTRAGGRDGLGEMRQVGDAALRAAHLRDDARVAVEERRVGQGVPARRRIAGRRPERTENAVHLGALHAGRHQVVVVEVLQPAADAVVALAGRGARSRRLLAGVGEEDVDQPRIGAERAVRAGDGGAAAAGEDVVDRDRGAAEPALGAVTARARLHVGALRRSVLEDVDVARERADAPPSR